MMILNPRQIVMPSGHIGYSNEYLSATRVYLLHVIDLETGKSYCGRDATGWDMPYRDESRSMMPTVEEILNDRYYCKQCVKALRHKVD